MKLPDHLCVLMALRRNGVPVHLCLTPEEIPSSAGRQLVLIGDDPADSTGIGPDGWHRPALRRLLRSLKPGAVGVFSGAPMSSVYEAMCFAAASLSGGAVIVETNAARFKDWHAYTLKHARHASRFDVAPPDWQPPADAVPITLVMP